MIKRNAYLKFSVICALIICSSIFFISCDSAETKHQKQANSYYDQSLWDNAIVEYSEVLKINPENIEALVNRGSAYTEKGEYDLAITDLNKAIEVDPENVIAYYNRGIVYLRRGDYHKSQNNEEKARADWQQAVDDCTHIIDSGLNNQFVLLHRGMAYKNLKNFQLAKDDFTRALTVSTNEEFNARVKLLLEQLDQEEKNKQ